MTALFDLLPLVAFFVAFKVANIFVATAVLMVAAVGQVAWTWLSRRQVAKLPLAIAAIALTLGGLTLAFHDERFIKWKVSVVYSLLAVVFLASNWIGERPLWQRALDEQFRAPRAVWIRLNTAWALLFLALAGTNAWLIGRVDTNTWVNLKVWGATAVIFVFSLAQLMYLSRHGEMIEPPPATPPEEPR